MSNETRRWYMTRQTFPELLHRNTTQFGHRRAQWWRDDHGRSTSLTYGEMGEIVKEMAGGLMAMGVEKGERIAIMSPTCPQWMWADYAILCAGGITVSVYPTLSAREVAYIINDSGSKILFVQDARTLEKVWEAWDEMPGLEQVVVFNPRNPNGPPPAVGLDALRARGLALLSKEKDAYDTRWRSVQLHDQMAIVYTSGTTGKPKGVVHTHFSMNAACIRDLSVAPEFKADDLLLSFLPLSHTYERECGHGTAMHGALTIAYSSPRTLVEDLQFFRPTVFMSVPRIYERIYLRMKETASRSPLKKAIFESAMKTGLEVINARTDKKGFIDMSEESNLLSGIGTGLKLKYKLFDRLVFSKVRKLLGGRFRFAFSAAGSLPADLCKTFMAMGVRIYEGYGSTETCNTTNLNRPDMILPGSVGAPCPGVEGRIAKDGEWQVRCDSLFAGYWNNAQATREAFTEDGFYKTGDIVKRVAGDYIRIVDRKNGLLVLDTGKNVPSAKIESLFSLSPHIDTVMALGSGEKFVSAIVVPDFDAVLASFNAKGVPYDRSALVFADGTCIRTGKDIAESIELKKLIHEDIRKANRQLEDYEKIKKFQISHRKFSEETGELTPTFKVKRNAVLENFASEINTLYH